MRANLRNTFSRIAALLDEPPTPLVSNTKRSGRYPFFIPYLSPFRQNSDTNRGTFFVFSPYTIDDIEAKPEPAARSSGGQNGRDER
jgi:hypothetical protein